MCPTRGYSKKIETATATIPAISTHQCVQALIIKCAWLLWILTQYQAKKQILKYIVEGSISIYCRRKFRSQTSDKMGTWKAEMGRVREEKRRRKRKSQKKADPGARKGRKVAKHCVFPMICGSGGSKSRLAKAAGAEPAGQMRDEKLHAVVARSTFASKKAKNTTFGALLEAEMSKKCTPLWREAHFQVKMHKTHHDRTTFGSWDV